jgi:hypothetical protein
MEANAPNVYNVLIALIQMIGTAFAVWIAYRQTTRNTASAADSLATKVEETTQKAATKLEEVHVAVNGNLDREKKKVAKYAKLLREHGIEPDDFPDQPA